MRHGYREPEAPDWFDLKKYSKLENFKPRDWYTQLVIRRECWDAAHLYSEELAAKKHPSLTCPMGFDSVLDLMHTNPIVKVKDLRRVCDRGFWGTEILLCIQPPRPAVDFVTVEELYLCRIGLRPDERRRFDQLLIAELHREGASPYLEHLAMKDDSPDDYRKSGLGAPVYKFEAEQLRAGHRLFKVDLSDPDELLVKSFRACLIRARKAANLPLKVGQGKRGASFSTWKHLGVLPYIDLKLWSRINNKRLSDGMLAELICPDGEGGEEHVRKYVQPLAFELMDRRSRVFFRLRESAAI
jgi:hypothetical protein